MEQKKWFCDSGFTPKSVQGLIPSVYICEHLWLKKGLK